MRREISVGSRVNVYMAAPGFGPWRMPGQVTGEVAGTEGRLLLVKLDRAVGGAGVVTVWPQQCVILKHAPRILDARAFEEGKKVGKLLAMTDVLTKAGPWRELGERFWAHMDEKKRECERLAKGESDAKTGSQ